MSRGSRVVDGIDHHLLRGIAGLHHVAFGKLSALARIKVRDDESVASRSEALSKGIGVEQEAIAHGRRRDHVEIGEGAHAGTVGIERGPHAADTRPCISVLEHRSRFLRDHGPKLTEPGR